MLLQHACSSGGTIPIILSTPNCPEDERRGLAVAPLRFAGIRGQRLPASIATH